MQAIFGNALIFKKCQMAQLKANSAFKSNIPLGSRTAKHRAFPRC